MSMTLDVLAKCNKNSRRRKDESVEDYLARQTHVTLVQRNLTAIANMRHCRSVTSLYLYENKIQSMLGLQRCVHLTHLYLQRNNIKRIEGVATLTKLEKLYLGFNEISVVEGLNSLSRLKELHIGHQRLPAGESLVFDPRTMQSLAGSLSVLDVSGNHVKDLYSIGALVFLEQLNLSENDIEDLQELAAVLDAQRYLARLRISDNPITEIPKYKDEVIVLSNSLIELDGTEITAANRQFLVNWKAAKSRPRRSKASTVDTSALVDRRMMPPLVPAFPSKFSAKNPNFKAPAPSKRASQAKY